MKKIGYGAAHLSLRRFVAQNQDFSIGLRVGGGPEEANLCLLVAGKRTQLWRVGPGGTRGGFWNLCGWVEAAVTSVAFHSAIVKMCQQAGKQNKAGWIMLRVLNGDALSVEFRTTP